MSVAKSVRISGAALICFASVTFALASSARASTGADLGALIESYERPHLGESVKVDNLTVPLSDRMTLRLLSGSAAPVTAAGQQIGFFFTGSGKLEYLSNRADEAVNVRFETRKTSDLNVAESAKGLVLTGNFDEVYVRVGGMTLPPLGAGAGDALSDAFAKHLEAMTKRRDQTETHQLVKQRINAPNAPVAVAEFFSGKNLLTYHFDRLDDWHESLLSYYRNRTIAVRELADAYWPVVLSDQPVGRSVRDLLAPPFLLSDLDYTLVADGQNAKLSIVETITPLNTPQSVFQSSLMSTIHDRRGGAHPFKVTAVRDGAGNPLPFHHANDDIVVALPRPAGVEQKFAVRFEIEGDFLIQPGGDSYWELGTYPWFPQPDLGGQYYTIHSLIKVKKPWTPFAPGVTVRRGEEGEYNIVENRVEKPVQFAVALAGNYTFSEEKRDGLTIRAASYAGNNVLNRAKLQKLAYDIIKFYEPWLGPFPFKEFNIIEIHELGFGQAPPATMFITKEAFNPIQGDDNRFFSQGINHRFAHEIAHQYWGHVVKMPSSEEQWITESFAEYSSSLVMKQMKGQSTYDAMLSTWQANANDAKSYSGIALANRINIPEDPRQRMIMRTYLVYDKGAFLLATIHKQLGDARFAKFMRGTQASFQWRFLTTNDIAKTLKQIEPSTNWDSFFDKYYWGTEMPPR